MRKEESNCELEIDTVVERTVITRTNVFDRESKLEYPKGVYIGNDRDESALTLIETAEEMDQLIEELIAARKSVFG